MIRGRDMMNQTHKCLLVDDFIQTVRAHVNKLCHTLQCSPLWLICDLPLPSPSYSCFGGRGLSPAGCLGSCTAASSASVRTAVSVCVDAAGCSPVHQSASAWWQSHRWCWPDLPGNSLWDTDELIKYRHPQVNLKQFLYIVVRRSI